MKTFLSEESRVARVREQVECEARLVFFVWEHSFRLICLVSSITAEDTAVVHWHGVFWVTY